MPDLWVALTVYYRGLHAQVRGPRFVWELVRNVPALVRLWLDTRVCPCCGAVYLKSTGFVLKRGSTYE